ncbi:hypothetical protein L596_029872 [Steinernema carpocapsae]|uniref:Uncharacterized protein n=1 Tax=Steinernema carpocapsae TaxID=34508 RepID=A0A4U5LR20_STECR|nr:hypothetical protein L596_029872 [Steinernema carpocapsae]
MIEYVFHGDVKCHGKPTEAMIMIHKINNKRCLCCQRNRPSQHLEVPIRRDCQGEDTVPPVLRTDLPHLLDGSQSRVCHDP